MSVVNNSINSASYPNNMAQIYFSQVSGNDTTGTGSLTAPVATINTALTIALGVSAENPPIIYGLDNAAYDEQLSLADNVTINAPQATISSSAGDTITFTGNLSTVTFAVIESNAGNPITQTGTGYNVANFQESNNWGTTGFDNTGTGTLVLNFYQTSVPIVSSSGGIISLSSPTFPSGTAPTGQLTGIAGGVNYGALNAGYGGSYAINVAASVSHTQVASGGHAPLITASSSTASYVISNIYLNRGSSFSGSSSDRNLTITDGTVVWTIVPTATLKATVNAVWGSTAVPFSVTYAPGSVSVPGQNIYAVYSGGTTDYIGGNIDFNILFSQVTN